MFFMLMALGPVAVLLGWIYLRDAQEKEPPGLLFKCLLGGVAAVAVVVVLGIFILGNLPELDQGPRLAFVMAFFTAAIPEEVTKFCFLFWLTWNHPAFNEKFDGIVYAVFISLGFAGVENLLYLSGANGPEEFLAVGLSRAAFSVPAHFLCAVLMGYYYSLAKFERRIDLLWFGLLAAILAHGIFDFILMWNATRGNEFWMGMLGIAFLLFNLLLWKVGIAHIQHLARLSAEAASLAQTADLDINLGE